MLNSWKIIWVVKKASKAVSPVICQIWDVTFVESDLEPIV
jgi:hypothetical protein